ncbi:MAG: hypothetical protein ALAOOOJD_03880 [bacterium]|nr:hypothetical protein [bacterium]
MRWYSLKTIFLFALCVAQFSMPLLSLTAELPCEEPQAKVCQSASCCQQAAATPMPCCKEATPTQSEPVTAAVLNPVRIHFDVAAPNAFVNAGGDFEFAIKLDYTFSSCNTHFAGNQLYKLLATFLI